MKRDENIFESRRLMELEGLRGIAAIVVVVFHALVIFYPSMFYGISSFAPIQHMRFEDNIFGSPLNVFISGAFAVSIFFVLSGFVLTIGYFQKKDHVIIRKLATKRYIRLMIPALASILLVWAVLQSGLNSGKLEAELITHAGSSSSLWNFVPNIFEAFKQGIWSIFSTELGATSYNSVLWTMQYEFAGSFLVFGTVLLFGGSRHRWLAYGVLILLTFNTWFMGFIAGMLLADVYTCRPVVFKAEMFKIFAWPILLLGLFLGGYPYSGVQEGVYRFIRIPNYNQDINLTIFTTIGATFVVYAILTIPYIYNFLRRPKVSNLGKYTYALYLTHLTVLFTVCTTLFNWLIPGIGYSRAVVLSVILTVPVIILVAWLFEKYIDAPAIRLSSKFAKWFETSTRVVNMPASRRTANAVTDVVS